MHPIFSTSPQRKHRRNILFPLPFDIFLLRSLLLLTVCICAPSAVRAQGYEALWKQVDDAARRDLPRTALQLTDSIRTKALAEANDAQLLRAWLLGRVYGGEIAPDSAVARLERMEHALETETRPVEQALWHAALGRAYSPVANGYRALGKWTLKEMEERSHRHILASMEQPELLHEARTDRYLPLWNKGAEGTESRYFGHDVLHIVARSARESGVLTASEKAESYRRELALYRRNGMADAALWLTLDSLQDFPHEGPMNIRLEDDARYRELQGMLAKSQGCETRYRLFEALTELRFRYEETSPVARHNDSLLVAVARQGEKEYGKDRRAARLRNFVAEMENPAARLAGWRETYYPGDSLPLTLRTRHLKRAVLRLTRLYESAADYANASESADKRAAKRGKTSVTHTLSLPADAPFAWQQRPWQLTAPQQPGVYYAELTADGKVLDTYIFHVSAVRAVTFSAAPGYHRLTVVDTRSGRPLPHASVTAYTSRKDGKLARLKVYHADAEGTVELNAPDAPHRDIQYFAGTEQDRASQCFTLYNLRYYGEARQTSVQTQVDLFSDRAIYRPGQQVQWGGVVYTRRGDEFRTEQGYECRVMLYNAQGKAIDSLLVRSDALGNLHGSFSLPATCLPGHFHLQTEGPARRGYLGFSVEEYKRPTFTATTERPKRAYAPGDTVQVCGTARTFSGVPVGGARVQFTVQRQRMWRSAEGEAAAQHGETLTDAEGVFHLPVFLALSASELGAPHPCTYVFRVDYTVTAENGETCRGETSLPVSTRSVWLEADVPSRICREQLPLLTVRQTNAAGESLKQAGSYALCNAEGETVDTGNFRTAEPFLPAALRTLPSGPYSFIYSTPDVLRADTARFVLMSEDDVRPADKEGALFTYQRQAATADTVWVRVGTPLEGATLFYDLVSSDRRWESRRYLLTDSLLHFQLTYQPDYGDGATAYFALVRDGQLYTFSASVRKPEPDKRLRLEWSSFRSRLTPGEHEVWRLRVLRPDGSPAEASVMARMYDASLDAFARNDWAFSRVGFVRSLPNARWSWRTPFHTGWQQEMSGSFPMKYLTVPAPAFTEWDAALFNYRFFSPDFRKFKQARMETADLGLPREAALSAPTAKAVNARTGNVLAEAAVEDMKQAAEGETGSGGLRTHFQETAFFLPALRTDKQGEVALEFTLPESMTRWNFTALAHDAGMCHGRIDTALVVQKQLMVEPALPRFLRRGDRTALPVKVTNLTGGPLTGTLLLTLEDALQPDRTMAELSRPFRLQPGEVQTLRFDYRAEDETSLLVCRAVARADHFSDGEEHLLPVWSDEVTVTRTLPFYLEEKGTLRLQTDTLFNLPHATHRRLEVELAAHPVWYVLSALPTLAAEAECQSATGWSTRFYALSLAAALAQQHPEIKAWADSLPCELQALATQRLAALSGPDTPWALRGETETARTAKLKELFNEEALAAHLFTATDKLRALQQPDGSWSWYPGMPGNTLVTLETALLLARAEKLTGSQTAAHDMLRTACTYLQHEMERQVAEARKTEARLQREVRPTESQLRWLYLRTLLGQQPDAAARFLLQRTKKLRHELTMYDKAVAAVVLAGAGETAEAQLTAQSLLEHTVSRPDMGRWFDTPRAERSWQSYRIPTQCVAVEALEQLGHTREADEMRRWLLQAKRTQQWETSRATADAVWLLLPSDSLPRGSSLNFTLYKGRKVVGVDTPADTRTAASVGYVRKVYDDQPAVEATQIKLTKTDDGPAWGSVRATFTVPASAVPTEGKELQAESSYTLWREGAWQPYHAGAPLHPGDRLRREFIVRADRDYDFVRLSSDRPACAAPAQPLSGYRLTGDLFAYAAVHDASTDYFIEHLPKGTHRLTEEWYIDRTGTYTTGPSRIVCVYSPEFTGTTESVQLEVE